MIRQLCSHLWRLAVVSATCAKAAAAGFGLDTGDPKVLTVNTGAGLVFSIRLDNPPGNRKAPGDLCSLVWNGRELLTPDRGSHIASGFPASTIRGETLGRDIIRITVESPSLTHWYVARRGQPNIYMATFVGEGWTLGETRWVTHLNATLFPKRPVCSDLAGTSGTIESRDIFGMPNGQTRSKYYGNARAKELPLRGVGGPGAGVFMAFGSRETSSGGPFFRDIENQSAEVYNYMNSGHAQTEPFRLGLHGFYALALTNGSAPRQPDFSFMGGLGFKGFVPAAARGGVRGTAISGRDPRLPYTVALANPAAQYWTDVHAADGAFAIPGVKPGSYRLQVFKNELAVYETTVAVTAGAVATVPPIQITGDPSMPKPLWRIGDWDGTPHEMLNGDKVTLMHPSDTRMAPWKPGPYKIGRSTPATGMPAYQWRGVNDGLTIDFNLAEARDCTLRIGITTACQGARPTISVNGKWSPRASGPTAQPDSRALTIGTYRGNNHTFTYTIPASALRNGPNSLCFGPLSGSGGSGFLSPGYSIDCIDLIPAGAD